MNEVSHFSINGFWVQLRSYLVSFGFRGLPHKVHLTIAFNQNRPDINFHITKEVNSIDKPRIDILKVDKQLFEQSLPNIANLILGKILQPLEIENFNLDAKENNAFVSLNDEVPNSFYSKIENGIEASFEDFKVLSANGTRLRIKGDVEERLVQFSQSIELAAALDTSLEDSSNHFNKPTDTGLLLTDNDLTTVVRVNDKYYKIRNDFTPLEFLSIFMDVSSAKRLIRHFRRSLVIVRRAKTRADTEGYNHPLIFKSKSV